MKINSTIAIILTIIVIQLSIIMCCTFKYTHKSKNNK